MFQGHTLYFFKTPAEPAPAAWWWEVSSNELDTLILVADTPQDRFGDNEAATLEKLVSAIKRHKDNTAVVTVGEDSLSLSALLSAYSPATVLLFGLDPAAVHLHVRAMRNQPVKWAGCTILCTDSLAQLDSDPSRKRALWSALQSIYL